MRNYLIASIILFSACNNAAKPDVENTDTISPFAKARQTFVTKITKKGAGDTSVPDIPPKGLLSLVQYPSQIGNMAAYISNIPQDGKLRPAIIWIIGGFGNSIGDVWTPQDTANDQSGSAFWRSGIVAMYPSLRGGNKNPGNDETFYGEIDDIVAAAKYLAKQPGIDPKRIYLGGHSTGGTKALLAAESTDIFRAVFSVGGVSAGYLYGMEHITFDTSNEEELIMRSPILWLSSIRKPVFMFDADEGSNIDEMRKIRDSVLTQHITQVHFYEVKGADHFTMCLPLTTAIAEKILADTNDTCNISFDEVALSKPFDRKQ